MKDLIGNPVFPGDHVAIARTGYRDLVVGKVLKLTPKGVQVEFRDWNGGKQTTYRQAGMFVRVVL